MYRPPPFEKAEQLAEEIFNLLTDIGHEKDGAYKNIGGHVEESIFKALARGTFFYSRERYFISFDCVDNGMFITELATRVGMAEIKRKLRRYGQKMKGLTYYRYKTKKLTSFPNKRGAYGR